MRIDHFASISALLGVVAAAPLRGLFRREKAAAVEEPAAAAADDSESPADDAARALQAGSGCYGHGSTPPSSQWHPQYSAGWNQGYCTFTIDCDSPGYATEFACCKGAYAGQTSGYCLSQLDSPPTTSPTDVGGMDVYYPDYDTSWPVSGCINKRPVPNGRPTYATMLACCKGAYGGQISGACLSNLPNPPTTSPTDSDGKADFWYPDYETSWPEAGCLNTLPLPFRYEGDRPTYDTQMACCKGSYGGQVNGKCLSQLESPPTTSPTGAGGLDYWYPDYDTSWAIAGCKNERPLPFSPGDRPTYDTQLACCKAAYGGQMSGACLTELESPPTTSPTGIGGADSYYPDYDTAWAIAGCKNERPLPFGPGDRPVYDSLLECCKTAYAGQVSGACLAELADPPTTSPTGSGGFNGWYRDVNAAWNVGTCVNDLPVPNNAGVIYSTQALCCAGAFAGQTGQACQCDADPCYSCNCGSQAALNALNCGLTCS